MIPYSNEYLLQYMATLDTSNYSQGLKGMQNQTEGTTNKIDSAFGKMTKSINAATIAKGAMAAAAIYVANKLIECLPRIREWIAWTSPYSPGRRRPVKQQRLH